MNNVNMPRIYVIGLSLKLYHDVFQDFDDILLGQLEKYKDSLSKIAEINQCEICRNQQQVTDAMKNAESIGVDCILLIPMCYTTSLMTLAPALETSVSIVIWNTQEAEAFDQNYDFDLLLRNHTAQGTQDLTNVLLRNGKAFGLESGHYKDNRVLSKLEGWFRAARAFKASSACRVGRLGQPFPGMGDFAVDENKMRSEWGPSIVELEISRFVELVAQVEESALDAILIKDNDTYLMDPFVTPKIHKLSARLELALRSLIEENSLDAFTMNFLDLIDDGRLPTIPFLGVNKLIGEGMGYAGEGDVVTAALMLEMRHLVGVSNFTEMFTVDYKNNHLLMTHMQECNPALAREDSRVKLVKKDFWADGVEPYVGMWFTLAPGDVTLICATTNECGEFKYILKEAEIVDQPPLENLDIPHWLLTLPDTSVEGFLTAYSLAGGSHHLCATPGKQSANIERLARFHGFTYQKI